MNLKHSGKSSKPLYRIITALESSHAILRTQVDKLYASLDVVSEFPVLHGISLMFLWTLLLACDLKTKIWTKAVGSFCEWERLDRAVGGHNIPLGKSLTNSGPCSYVVAGTKLHQATCNAITKQKPTRLALIRKYNKSCQILLTSAPLNCPLPVPKPLPLELDVLWDMETSGLMEDVWITPSKDSDLLCWLEDPDVCKGIQAMIVAEKKGRD